MNIIGMKRANHFVSLYKNFFIRMIHIKEKQGNKWNNQLWNKKFLESNLDTNVWKIGIR